MVQRQNGRSVNFHAPDVTVRKKVKVSDGSLGRFQRAAP
jgi:hypothetical protein